MMQRTLAGNHMVTSKPWIKHKPVNGSIGSNVDVALDGNRVIFAFQINAPLANEDATLKIYTDSVAAGNLIFDGHIQHLDSDNEIKFPEGKQCSAKFVVLVTGGSGNIYIDGKYI